VSFFRSFYVRLSLVFLALILILAVLHARIAANVFDRQREEIDQRANAMLAADMAKEIEPYIGAGEEGDGEALGSAIHYMMVLNPLIEIYLISGSGEILSYFAVTSSTVHLERVDIAPVRAFLGRDDPFPIYGDDPRRPNEATTFSAAPLKVPGGGDGYVYVVLRSSLYDSARSEIEDEYFRAAFRESLFYTLPLVALLGLLVFFLLTYRLQGLTNVVRAFGNGAYDVRATVASRDEVGELAASFNFMARQIESSVEAIERAERERRDLVANISHDLRTPLSSIRGYIETLLHREPSLSADDRKKYLEISLSSAEALGRLVDDLFELSRLERAGQGISSEVFSLSELCHDT
jgi:signal transduction histidine kinase